MAGNNAHRVDGMEKVTGRAVYTADLQLPGMAYAKVLRSPVAHARVMKVDVSKAKEIPGVIATLTRDEIKDSTTNMARRTRISPSSQWTK